jgi:ribosomal protein L11 methylase PrmA
MLDRGVTGVQTCALPISAVRNVEENSLLNIIVKEGEIFAVSGSFDLIVANLLSGILVDISPEIATRLNPGGKAILSGMLSGQENDVIKAYEKAGLSLSKTVVGGQWVTLVFSR